jgi:hypothetical protein
MREVFKTLKEIAGRLYPYISPSWDNLSRTITLIGSNILIPAANIIIPFVFFKTDQKGECDDKCKDNSLEIIVNVGFACSAAILLGLQQGLVTKLQESTMQAIRRNNINKLTDDKAKFLIYGDYKDIKSVQYVTVGEGVRSFTNCSNFFYYSVSDS